MNILAIDTASEYLSLAISQGEHICSSLDIVNNQQSNYIIIKIQELLKQQNLSINNINLIAYNQGPGSFTGLRIGLSVALGIAIGLNIDLVPVPAFDILAKAANLQNSNLLIGIDARLEQIYIAGLRNDTSNYLVEPSLVNFANIPSLENYTFCGYGLQKYWAKLNPHTQKMPFISLDYPNAVNIINLVKDNKYQPVKATEAKLFYLGNKIALSLEEQQNAAKSKY